MEQIHRDQVRQIGPGAGRRKGEEMGIVALLSRGRIVELNKVLEPGKEERRLEIRRFKIFAGEFMHDIDTMSHVGTHAICVTKIQENVSSTGGMNEYR